MPPARPVSVEGLFNVRDLGGLPLVRGGTTPEGVLVRSESPDLVPASGWSALRDHGIRTVVDLRQGVERDAAPRPPWLQVRHVDHDGLADHPDFWADYWDNGLVGTPLYYLPHLAALPERTVEVLDAIATAPDGGVLFHCAGGRDRTGIVAGVLLTIAGVEREAIVADYLETISNAPAMSRGRGRPDQEAEITALLAERGTTSEQAFRDFLDGLDVEALLAALPPDTAEALRTWRGSIPVGHGA